MENIFRFNTKADNVPSAVLAYIGDAVLELVFRLKFAGNYRVSTIHEKVKEWTSKHGQAQMLDAIWDHLMEGERKIVKRAMNSKAAKRYGNDPLYRKSTGFEALVGYLFLKRNFQRIQHLLAVMDVEGVRKEDTRRGSQKQCSD
ncbi:MAG: ribonuclease III [Thermotoga sp.]|nr:ribonuclease III [Thermotoga sp.]